MDVLIMKFPHLLEQIFQKLNDESLIKSREVEQSWQYFIDEKNYPWLRIVNIPTILKRQETYLHLAAETGQLEIFKIALSETEYNKTEKAFSLIGCAKSNAEC